MVGNTPLPPSDEGGGRACEVGGRDRLRKSLPQPQYLRQPPRQRGPRYAFKKELNPIEAIKTQIALDTELVQPQLTIPLRQGETARELCFSLFTGGVFGILWVIDLVTEITKNRITVLAD